MHNLMIATLILAFELVLIGLGGAIYFLARRAASRQSSAEPPQDFKALAPQLVQVHEATVKQVQYVGAAGAAAEAEAALKKAVARLRAVAAQLATGRVSAAALGQGVLEAHEQVLLAWQQSERNAPAPEAPAPAARLENKQRPATEPVTVSDEELQAEIRALAPPE